LPKNIYFKVKVFVEYTEKNFNIEAMYKNFLIIFLFFFLFSPLIFAKGNIASKPTRLEPLILSGKDLSLSQSEYFLETGKYYKLSISSDGYEEFMFQSPDLFRNVWINQIIINEIEIHGSYPYGIEFDDEGTADIWFVPIRPGKFQFGIKGFENKGMIGFIFVE